MEIVTRWSIPVLEDCPYAELRFEGDDLPSLKSMDEKGLVVFLGSFSKVFCPGLSSGWTAAAPEILRKLVIAKQGADLPHQLAVPATGGGVSAPLRHERQRQAHLRHVPGAGATPWSAPWSGSFRRTCVSRGPRAASSCG